MQEQTDKLVSGIYVNGERTFEIDFSVKDDRDYVLAKDVDNLNIVNINFETKKWYLPIKTILEFSPGLLSVKAQ